jgi:hypothetical protein
MSGRPAVPPARTPESEAAARANANLPRLRLEILQELQQLIDNREARDRIDRGPLAEAKGREHWVLHLLLRAEESSQAHLDRLVGSSYANLNARLQSVEDRLAAFAEADTATRADLIGRLDVLSTTFAERFDRGFAEGTDRIAETASTRLAKELGDAWRPIGESIESFSQGSKAMVQEVSDTYKVATQTRLLLNENARRISDLGRDLLSLEDSLKLVVQRAVEEGVAPIEQRIAQLEARLGIPAPTSEVIAASEPVEAAASEAPKPAEPGPDG